MRSSTALLAPRQEGGRDRLNTTFAIFRKTKGMAVRRRGRFDAMAESQAAR